VGLTCATIQVFAGDLQEAEGEAGVDRLIQSACRRIGYEPVDEPPAGERQLAVVLARSWLSILDQESTGVVTGSLVDLARELSKVSGGPVLVASVHDSDGFAFLLFERGKQVDGHASNDGLVPIKFKKWPAKKRAQEWSRAFGKMVTAEDFQRVLEPAGPFADDQLVRLCQLLEIPPAQAKLTWKDLDREPQLARRIYSLRSPAAGGTGMAVAQVVPSGVDAAVVEQYTGKSVKPMSLLVQECGYVAFELSGPAEAFVDPVLEISGTAIDQNLIEVVSGGGTWNGGTVQRIMAGQVCQAEARWETDVSGGRRVVRGRLLGMAARGGPFPPGHQTKLMLGVSVRGVAEGAGDFQVVCRPQGQRTEQLSLFPVCRAEVATARWIPRGCRQGQVMVDQGIRQLNTPAILSGVAILKDDEEEATGRVRPLIESWLGWLGKRKPGSVRANYLGQMNPVTCNCPKRKSELPLAEVGGGKKWQKLFDQPGKMLGLFFQMVEGAGEKPWAGAALQRNFFDPDYDKPGNGTIHASFWLECARAGEEAIAAARAHLTRLIDSAFESGTGLQGWVARWGWVPLFSTGDANDYSPYEDALGLDRACETRFSEQGFMSLGWCKGTLRGLGSPLWLGRDLLAWIVQPELEKVARVEEIGPFAVRVETAPDDLPRLEEVLHRIVPRAPKVAAPA
jgi:hypothetical protein